MTPVSFHHGNHSRSFSPNPKRVRRSRRIETGDGVEQLESTEEKHRDREQNVANFGRDVDRPVHQSDTRDEREES